MDLVHKIASFLRQRNRKALWLCGFLFVIFPFWAYLAGNSRAEEAAAPAPAAAPAASPNQELIDQKIEELSRVQSEIARLQEDIRAKRAQGDTLENEIAIFDAGISKNQLEIRETRLNIEQAEMEMEGSQNQIEEDRVKIEDNKKVLKEFIRTLYSYDNGSFLEVLMSRESISDFFNEVSAVKAVQGKILNAVIELKREREELAERTRELEDSRLVYADLIRMRYEQNTTLENLKAQKSEILEITNGEEGRYQALVVQNRRLLPSLRAELRDLQSLGSDIEFDDAISAAKYVGEVTGVRPAFLLGVLRVESGLGTNVGGGNYKTDMNPSQWEAFEAITAQLGYDPNVMPVSRKPSAYSGWGGAMGPAQMMPTTWLSFRDRVSELTKHDPPDPWSLTDSIAAMAIKLSQIGGVTEGNYDAEYEAAGRYLAGNNWRRFLFYPDKVMYYADLYAKELGG